MDGKTKMKNHNDFIASLKTEAAPQDVSLPVLEQLLGEGYDTCTWNTSPSATDGPCISMGGEVIPLADFIANLMYAAPLFEKTHVGCHCSVSVSGPGLDPREVSAFGFV